MGKQYCVCHLLTGHSYYSFWFLGDSFFFNFESPSIAFLLLFKGFLVFFFFFFLIFPSKKSSGYDSHLPRVCGLQTDLLCMHSPSVQFLDCKTMPSQSLPPFLGAGAVHSLRRQWVHSVPQVDHLLQEVHLPSTATKNKHTQRQVKDRRSFLKAERGRAQVETKHEHRRKRATRECCIHFNCWKQQHMLSTHPAGSADFPSKRCGTISSLTKQGKLNGTHRNQSCHQELYKG